LKGGKGTLAISKEKKREVVAQYQDWMERSKAMVVTEYVGLNMNDLDELRAKIREAGGEFHIVKNTLVKLALKNVDLPIEEQHFLGSTAIGFAFEDPPALAKAMTDFAKESDYLKIKFGYLDKQLVAADEVKALANMPPLPVMRAQLLSALLAPATQLASIFAAPGRQIAAVVKAFSEQAPVGEAA
jgi:large subunit ribosomal protein L10